MKRHVLMHRDDATGLFHFRYGNQEARAVVVQASSDPLTAEQLLDLDAMLDIVIEDEAKAKASLRRPKPSGEVTGFCGPLIDRSFPGAKVWVDTRQGRLS